MPNSNILSNSRLGVLCLAVLWGCATPSLAAINNNATSYCTFAHDTSLQLQTFTVAAWVTIDTSAHAEMDIFAFGPSAGSPFILMIFQDKLYWFAADLSPNTLQGATALNTNTPHHLAMTRAGGTGAVLFYVDGVQDATATMTGTIGNGDGAGVLFAHPAFNNQLLGSVADMTVWNVALSGAQIASLAASRLVQWGGATSQPVTSWSFEECGTGATCSGSFVDRSGAGHPCTIVGTGLTGLGENYRLHSGGVQ